MGQINRVLRLDPLKSNTQKIKKTLGFDIETKGDKNDFVCACFCNETERYDMETPQDIKLFLDQRFLRDYDIVCTNLGFDFLGLFLKELQKYDNYRTIEKDKLYAIKYYQKGDKKKVVTFYDTVNYHGASVEQLGELVGVAKLPHPASFGRHWRNKKEKEDLQEYCYNDALISCLFFDKFIKQFCRDNNIKLKLTMPSLSLAHFRTNFLDDVYFVENKNIRDMCKASYFGGRTECFRRGTYTNVNCYDFNSLYPSVMINEFPNPNTGVETNKHSMNLVYNYDGVCYVEGYQEDTFIPLLPFKDEINGHLLFPKGKIKGYYTHIELREALKNGFTINKFGKGVYYRRNCKPFKKFVEKMYALRLQQQKEKSIKQKITKLCLNGLYGKFGFNYTKSSEIKRRSELTHEDIDNMLQCIDLDFGFIRIEKEADMPTNYTFPIWAAYTTAMGRIKLYKEMKKNEKNILYCDTDSLFLKDGAKIESSNALGKLKHEYNTSIAIFVKCKHYLTDKKIKVKGIKTKLDKEKFISVTEGNPITEKRFTKFRTVLNSKDHHKLGKLQMNQMFNITKRLKNQDTKRKWSNTFDYTKQETSQPLSDVAQ